MRLQLNLWQKALLLITLPLLFELAFVGTLLNSLDGLEQQYQKTSNAWEASVLVNTELASMLKALNALFMVNVSHETRYFSQFEEAIANLTDAKNELQKLDIASINPEVEAFNHSTSIVIDSIQKAHEIAKTRDRFDIYRSIMKLQSGLNKANELARGFIKSQAVTQQSQREKQNNLQALLKSQITIGVMTSIGLALALALYFIFGTARRLDVINRNIGGLSIQRPLENHIGGADELARIDNSFHKMADELAALRSQQQQMYSMITHDLRAPLTSVRVNVDLLKMGAFGDLNEIGLKRLSLTDYLLNKMVALTHDLLDIDKLDSNTYRINSSPTDLTELVNRCVEMVSPAADMKNITVERATYASVSVSCDTEKISRVVTNLLDNAIKFSPRQSMVTILVGSTDKEARVEIFDEGPGVALTDKDKIFERYHQSDSTEDSNHRGFGLGLAICKLLVEAHGGKIGVESRADEKQTVNVAGSKFWFTLPS